MQPATLVSLVNLRKDPAGMKAELMEIANIMVARFLVEQIDNFVTGMSAYLGDLKRGSRSQPAMCPLGGCLRDAH